MKSDIYIVRVEMKNEFEKEISEIAKLQASRDNPRKLVSSFVVNKEVVLIFELV